MPQVHPRLVRRAATLAVIASAARAHQVVPAVAAAAVPRYDVIQRQVARANAAVLARVVIANEDLAARQPHEGDLEYERAPFLGLLVDLNGDGVPEYLVRAAPARCSERGCPYAIFDGASFHSLGTIFGSVIYVRAARSETFAIINTFSPNGGDSATYTTYAYNHTRYVARESVQLSGDALRRLRDELAGAQSGQ